ncbi:hypothetical protein ACC759_37825, partial [Rhizobium ruizarguesonis]
RKTAFRLREAEVVPDQVHQIGAFFSVVYVKPWIETDLTACRALSLPNMVAIAARRRYTNYLRPIKIPLGVRAHATSPAS